MRRILLFLIFIWFSNIIFAQQAVPCYIPSNGLVAWYPFNGNANDESGNSNNNGIVNGATLTSDRNSNLNSAYYFDGIDDFISGSCTNFPTDSRTVSVWFSLDDLTNHHTLLGYGGRNCGESFVTTINQSGAGLLIALSHCNGTTGAVTSNGYPSDSVWYNFIVTSGNGEIKFYMNGSLVYTTPVAFGGTYVNGKQFAFGVSVALDGSAPFTNVDVGYLHGKLDDIGIWNRVLDMQEIQQIYEASSICQTNNGLNFDGGDDFISVPHNSNFNLVSFTLEAWVKTTINSQSYKSIITKPADLTFANYGLGIYDGKSFVNFQGPFTGFFAYGNSNISDGIWHHLAGVYDQQGGSLKIYVDGNLEASTPTSAIPITGAIDLQLGRKNSAAGLYFQGDVDEVRVWNFARSEAEIISTKYCEIASPQTGLVTNYHFNQGVANGNNQSDTTLFDASGNNLNGTLNNFTLIGSNSNWVSKNQTFNINPAGPLTICNNDSIKLNVDSASCFIYQWYKNNTPILYANESYYWVKETGNYNVRIISNSDTSNSQPVTVNTNLCSSIISFNPNGNAILVSDSCIRLTSDFGALAGSAWNNSGICISKSFEINFDANFGVKDGNGADGISFVLQNAPAGVNYLGGAGHLMGYSGANPSLAIEFDDYDNGYPELSSDHIDVTTNGNVNNYIISPVPCMVNSGNIEDGLNHNIKIKWDKIHKAISIYFDGVLRVSFQFDLEIYFGTNIINWGFTAGTGALSNIQSVCLNSLMYFETNALSIISNGAILKCPENSVVLSSSRVNGNFWNNGMTSQDIVVYQPGSYYVINNGDTSNTIVVSNYPVPVFSPTSNSPICSNATLQLNAGTGNSCSWTGPDNFSSNLSNPAITNASSVNLGTYTVTAANIYGCTSTAAINVFIKSSHLPVLSFANDNPSFSNNFVNPLNGTPTDIYTFKVNYIDSDGELPVPLNPKVNLDFEGNGVYTDNYDRQYAMIPVDANDTNTVDGKMYYFTAPFLRESSNWKTLITVSDTAGCEAQAGPFAEPNVQRLPDVSIFANDISFSNSHPAPNSYINVNAVVHNNSSKPADSFYVRLKNLRDTNILYPDIFIAHISANATCNVNWLIQTPVTPAFCPMQIIIDNTNVISESNELDNQAIRAYINGLFTLSGKIVTTGSVSPNPVCPGSYFNVSGKAVYTNLAVPINDSSCAGATVLGTVMETGQTVQTYTQSNGNYSFYLNAPVTQGTFHIKVYVTDYTLEDSIAAINNVLPNCQAADVNLLSCNGALRPKISLSGGLTGIGSIVIKGQAISCSITVTNYSNNITDTSILHLYSPDSSPIQDSFIIPPLNPGENIVFNILNIVFNNVGNAIIAADADCNDAVYIGVLPDLPDLTTDNINAYGECPVTINAAIKNIGGIASGTFIASLTIRRGNIIDTTMYQQMQSLQPLQSEDVTFSFNPTHEDNYNFEVYADPGNLIIEESETNNINNTDRHIAVCKPDLVSGHCGLLSINPEDKSISDYVSLNAAVINQGMSFAKPPIRVKFDTGDSLYYSQITDTLFAGQSRQITRNIYLPNGLNNLLSITIDDNNQIPEDDESNNVYFDSIFYDFTLSRLPGTPFDKDMFWDFTQQTNHPIHLNVGVLNTGLLDASHLKVKFEWKDSINNYWSPCGGSGIAQIYSPNQRATNDPFYCGKNYMKAELSAPFAFPHTGKFLVRMTADNLNEYAERNEFNNELVVEVNVSNFSDYRVLSQYIAPANINPDINEADTITVTYENIGNDDPDSLELFLEVNSSAIDSITVGGLLGQSYSTIQFDSAFLSSIVGFHVLRAIIDHDDEIYETNETNNEATRSIYVGTSPNLKFDTFTVSNSNPLPGSKDTIHSVIRNTGKIRCNANYVISYIDNFNNKMIFHQQSISVDSLSSIQVDLNWFVADPRTTITAEILNAVPIENNSSDNAASLKIGEIKLNSTGRYAACNSQNLGMSKVIVTGGQPPYFYQWSNGRSNDSILDHPGKYTVIVTDFEGTTASISDSIISDPFQFEICGNNIDDNCNNLIDENCTDLLNIKMYIEGFYTGSGIMRAAVDPLNYPTLCDTVIVELHNSLSPYYLLTYYKGTIDINGNGVFIFPASVLNNEFYIVIIHRNGLTTWSSHPVLFNNANLLYDFSDTISKAYGCNLKNLGDGNFALWSGDISDAILGAGYQDGVIESRDYSDMENAVFLIAAGYIPEDITGDGIVESDDYSLMENNLYYVITAMRP